MLNPKLSLYENLENVRLYLSRIHASEMYSILLKCSLEVAEKYEVEAAVEAEPVEGVYETLRRLKSMGMKLALITNNCLKATELTLHKLKLRRFFHLVVTRDHVGVMKPSPKPVRYALSKLKVEESETIMVGDSTIDVRSALKAGVTAVGVARGVGFREALERAGACYVVESIRELPSLLRSAAHSGRI